MPFANPGGQGGEGRVGEPTGPEAWFHSLPFITKYWFGITFILTLAGNFGILSPYYYLWKWNLVIKEFQVWRVATCFCYAGGFDFNTLIALYMLVSFSKQYENSGPFNTGAGGGTADFAFHFLFGAIMMFCTYPFLSGYIPPLFCRNMIYYILYIWSRRHPEAIANIWGVPMKAVYLPFAYMALTIFIGGSYLDMLHGIAVGHFFYFLADVVPQVYGKDILQTPMFLIDYFGVGHYTPDPAANVARNNPYTNRGAAEGAAAGGGAAAGRGGHTWGTGGRTLGRD